MHVACGVGVLKGTVCAEDTKDETREGSKRDDERGLARICLCTSVSEVIWVNYRPCRRAFALRQTNLHASYESDHNQHQRSKTQQFADYDGGLGVDIWM